MKSEWDDGSFSNYVKLWEGWKGFTRCEMLRQGEEEVCRISVDLADTWGTHGERQRWIGAEWGEIWGGVSPLRPTRGSGERRELLQRGPGRAPAGNGFWRILKATERSLLYMTKSGYGGQFALASPLQILGDLSHRLPTTVMFPILTSIQSCWPHLWVNECINL